MSSTGSSFCTTCTAGKYSTASGGVFENNCTSCPPGTYTAFGGLSACSNCSSGFFRGDIQAPDCTKCSAGSYSDSGVSACTQCNAGSAMTYSATNTVFFVADHTNLVVRQVSPTDGSVTTVAGSGVSGNANGNGRAATFSYLGRIALSYDQKLLYIASSYCIRSMTTNDGLYTVGTVVGVCGSPGQAYGSLLVARLVTIYAICVDPDGTGLYIADSNHRVKYFEFQTQTLRALIGDGNGGSINGYNVEARLNTPRGLFISPDKAFMLISSADGIFHFNMSTQYARNLLVTGSFLGQAGELVMNTNRSIIYTAAQTDSRIIPITYPEFNAPFQSTAVTVYSLTMMPGDDTRLYYVDATTIRYVNLTSFSTLNLVSGSTTAGCKYNCHPSCEGDWAAITTAAP